VIAGAATLAAEEEKKVDLKLGDPAPQFTSVDDQGKPWKSADHVGEKILVVYFYPADLTPGCTRQACGFRDDMNRLKDEAVEVIGISGDSVANHQLFKKVHDLNFTLLADEKGQVADKFGVPYGEGGTITREFDGQEHQLTRGVTIRRWTFVIDKDKKIALKDTEVDAANDSKRILQLVEELKKK
jgi:peroxiredoxin Q/BCP